MAAQENGYHEVSAETDSNDNDHYKEDPQDHQDKIQKRDDEDSEAVDYQNQYEDEDDDNQQKYLYQEELSVYKAVCDNIKHTLAQIKGYSKVTLMSDPKASYFTIVDAVLSGPQALNPDELISVLGVS